MKIERYLERISVEANKPSLEYLHTLQETHMTVVPFENLDVIRRVPIYLRLSSIYEKIVTNHRGGYCYELNGLYHWALEQLGFNARIVPASVMRPNGKFAKEHTHVAMIVTIDGADYLTDVGFGNAQYAPLALDGTEHTDVSGTYCVKQTGDGVYRLMRKHDDEWKTVYEFLTTEWQLTDFHEGCVFNQVSSESSFTETDLVTMATADGRITLRDHELTTVKNGETTKIKVSADGKAKLMKMLFRIHL